MDRQTGAGEARLRSPAVAFPLVPR
jgi:hypothetical protein